MSQGSASPSADPVPESLTGGLAVPDAPCLLIVPPFAMTEMPSYAAHLLQACARQAGIDVRVLYANLWFAGTIGPDLYRAILEGVPHLAFPGERLFAAAAFGRSAIGAEPPRGTSRLRGWTKPVAPVPWADLQRVEQTAVAWAAEVATAVVRAGCRVVGCTSSFSQTAASVALLDRIKAARPDIVTILGGANCEDEMARGITSLGARIDVVFAGESEVTFPAFLRSCLAGTLPASPVVPGVPCHDLDALPDVDYAEFFEQRARLLPSAGTEKVWVPYESSRGCWWGQKSHCTFCGLNGTTMTFRERSPDRVLRDVARLYERYGVRRVCMLDNIMPHTYFASLVPRLGASKLPVQIHYEQKANLSLQKVIALRNAQITQTQPGIEALSTPLLKLMAKGVSGPQNIATLRYGRAARVSMKWNLLFDFPGDELSHYEETLRVVPLLRHLQPPVGFCALSVDRFSPYFRNPSAYGVARVRPAPAYADIFPPSADLEALAYHFQADYPSAARQHPGLVDALEAECAAWVSAWESPSGKPPALFVQRAAPDVFVLTDTRGLPGTKETQILSGDEAAAALAGGRLLTPDAEAWALQARVGLRMDGQFVPLAVAAPELLLELEAGARSGPARSIPRAPASPSGLVIALTDVSASGAKGNEAWTSA